ncbi:MAG: hypothetical protein RL546_314 [Chloroflexota bacterium]|jgi:uncharacterized membrane protein YcaP (DUF421 family)
MEFALDIVFRTVVVYLFLLLGLRLIGRGEAAQLRSVDLVLILIIANAVQNAMVGPDTSLAGGLIAASTILILARGLRLLEGRFPALRKSVEGEPILLARHGRISQHGLARAGMTLADLEVAMRRAGIESAERISLAILETDGSVSVIGS